MFASNASIQILFSLLCSIKTEKFWKLHLWLCVITFSSMITFSIKHMLCRLMSWNQSSQAQPKTRSQTHLRKFAGFLRDGADSGLPAELRLPNATGQISLHIRAPDAPPKEIGDGSLTPIFRPFPLASPSIWGRKIPLWGQIFRARLSYETRGRWSSKCRSWRKFQGSLRER